MDHLGNNASVSLVRRQDTSRFFFFGGGLLIRFPNIFIIISTNYSAGASRSAGLSSEPGCLSAGQTETAPAVPGGEGWGVAGEAQ